MHASSEPGNHRWAVTGEPSRTGRYVIRLMSASLRLITLEIVRAPVDMCFGARPGAQSHVPARTDVGRRLLITRQVR